jgi:hypothetical protein
MPLTSELDIKQFFNFPSPLRYRLDSETSNSNNNSPNSKCSTPNLSFKLKRKPFIQNNKTINIKINLCSMCGICKFKWNHFFPTLKKRKNKISIDEFEEPEIYDIHNPKDDNDLILSRLRNLIKGKKYTSYFN